MRDNQTQINVDLSKSTPVKCDNCGNFTFQEVVLMFFLSALISPTGQAGNVPLPTFSCNACGHVNNAFLPKFLRTEAEEAPKPSSLIVSEATALPPVSLKLEK